MRPRGAAYTIGAAGGQLPVQGSGKETDMERTESLVQGLLPLLRGEMLRIEDGRAREAAGLAPATV